MLGEDQMLVVKLVCRVNLPAALILKKGSR